MIFFTFLSSLDFTVININYLYRFRTQLQSAVSLFTVAYWNQMIFLIGEIFCTAKKHLAESAVSDLTHVSSLIDHTWFRTNLLSNRPKASTSESMTSGTCLWSREGSPNIPTSFPQEGHPVRLEEYLAPRKTPTYPISFWSE